MKIDEIELVSIGQSFPIELVEKHLQDSTPIGMIKNFVVYYKERNDQRILILADNTHQIAAYTGFRVRLNGRVWQAKNAASYSPYSGQGLVGKMYQFIKQQLKKSIQSDEEQTVDGQKLWTKTLPGLGLLPMIYDTETGHIIDPKTNNVEMYPVQGSANQYRYTWILEKFDHYQEQNILAEGSLLMPLKGLWYEFDQEKSQLNSNGP